jgi:D-inositol-3-phosphate glycosyltransferase
VKSDPSPRVGRLYSAAPWANLTGAPICALEHAKAMKGAFDEVGLVLCEHGPLEDLARESGVPTWCSPFVFRGLRRTDLPAWIRGIGAVVRSRWQYVRGLHRLLKEKPGILHIHSRAAHLPYALLAGRWARVPVVVTIHEPWAGGWEARSELWMIRAWADRVVFLTRAMVAQYPRVLRRVSVVYNHFPVLPKRPPPGNARPVVAMVGWMAQAKGTDVFLRTCRSLVDSGVAFEAWMAGQWTRETDRAEAERFIDDHHLRDSVSILGLQNRMEPIYAKTDVLLQPTRRDSFPRAVMEAMAHGIPVVATRVDGLPEMVEDGVTGFLVESGDVDGFAAATARLLADPELRERMGAAGRNRAEKLFAPGVYTAALLGIYGAWRSTAGGVS